MFVYTLIGLELETPSLSVKQTTCIMSKLHYMTSSYVFFIKQQFIITSSILHVCIAGYYSNDDIKINAPVLINKCINSDWRI